MSERDPEQAGSDPARGEESEGESALSRQIDAAEAHMEETREEAGEAAAREGAGVEREQDVGGESPELDRPDETPPARQ